MSKIERRMIELPKHGRFHPTCAGCGADLRELLGVSLDYPSVEWVYFCGQIAASGYVAVDGETWESLPDEPADPTGFTCANCGDALLEAP